MIWTDRFPFGWPSRVVLAAGLLIAPLSAAARPPLSASDWLSGSIRPPDSVSAWRPGDATPPDAQPAKTRKDVAKSGAVEPVGVTRLGAGNPDSKGTVSARSAGLPVDLWGESDATTLTRLVGSTDPRLPAMRRLTRRLLVAQLDPPRSGDSPEGQFFLARVDKLLDMGATGAAQDLIQAAGPADPERFRRLFDIALLSGDEGEACQIMDQTPGVAPSFPARIYCLALGGDWAAAALVYHGAESAGLIEPRTAALLAHFLDDAYADDTTLLEPPERVTPLDLRLHEAIGQPLPLVNLPLAFALADLGQNGGWKARLDAAERLARAGAIPASQLRRIYLEQRPAASGGVWDRAAAVQQLNAALTARDPAAVSESLPLAVERMLSAGLGSALADMVGPELGGYALSGKPGQLALWLALGSGQWRTIQNPPADTQPFDLWLLDFASGLAAATPPAGQGSERAQSIAPAFGDAPLPESAARLIAGKQRGEALLAAIKDCDAGLDGDLARAARGLRVLRALGQGEFARQAAIELILSPALGTAPGTLAAAP